MKLPTYRRQIKILDTKYISCYIYYMRPGGIEKPHYHDGYEVEYVISGSTKTHQKGRLYFRNKGAVHDGINDTEKELIFLNIMIPAELKSNTHYINQK